MRLRLIQACLSYGRVTQHSVTLFGNMIQPAPEGYADAEKRAIYSRLVIHASGL